MSDTVPHRIGLLGGSFDPPHLAHLIMAQDAQEAMQLNEFVFIPAAVSPFKHDRNQSTEQSRLEMLEAAVTPYKSDRNWSVDPLEIQRGGVSYSVDTVKSYRARFPHAELYWTLGADLLNTLTEWHRIEEMAAEVRFLAMHRPGYDFCASDLPEWVSCNKIEEHNMHISSSEIRSRVQQKRPIELFVPESVLSIIHAHQLYI